MGYTKHLFRIVGKKQPTVNDYKELAKVIIRVSEGEISALKIHDGVMDDSNYNTADGAKWYSFREQIRKIARKFPKLNSLLTGWVRHIITESRISSSAGISRTANLSKRQFRMSLSSTILIISVLNSPFSMMEWMNNFAYNWYGQH